jgi:hypothetical protein
MTTKNSETTGLPFAGQLAGGTLPASGPFPSLWLTETRGPDGRWQANLTHGDRPTERSSEGRHRPFRYAPVPVPPPLHGCSLPMIRRACAPQGDLAFVPPDALAALLRHPTAHTLRVPVEGRT